MPAHLLRHGQEQELEVLRLGVHRYRSCTARGPRQLRGGCRAGQPAAAPARAVAILRMVRGQLAAADIRKQAAVAKQRQGTERGQPTSAGGADSACFAPRFAASARAAPCAAVTARACPCSDGAAEKLEEKLRQKPPPHLNFVSPSTMRRTAGPKWKWISSRPTTSPQSSTVSCSRPAQSERSGGFAAMSAAAREMYPAASLCVREEGGAGVRRRAGVGKPAQEKCGVGTLQG